MGRHDGYDIALRECTAPLQDADKKFMEHLQRGRWEIVQFHFADQRFSALGDSPGWFRNCVNTANNILLSKTLTSGKKADQRSRITGKSMVIFSAGCQKLISVMHGNQEPYSMS